MMFLTDSQEWVKEAGVQSQGILNVRSEQGEKTTTTNKQTKTKQTLQKTKVRIEEKQKKLNSSEKGLKLFLFTGKYWRQFRSRSWKQQVRNWNLTITGVLSRGLSPILFLQPSGIKRHLNFSLLMHYLCREGFGPCVSVRNTVCFMWQQVAKCPGAFSSISPFLPQLKNFLFLPLREKSLVLIKINII